MAAGTGALSGDPPGLPRAAVARWLHQHVPDLLGGGSWQAEVIAGGLSNIMYRLRSGERSVVLRRPPMGDLLPSAHDMVREYTVQSALATSPVPVPELLAICRDESVIGVPFYVMQDVPGAVMRTRQDTVALDPVARAGVAGALVRTLVDLHAVDIEAVGLAEFGRAAGYAQRQVRRWGQQWERSATRELPQMATLLRLLAQ
ncbi:MAG: phosphotransferase family protein, partial [Candidatus Nanopelagicales bacterium]